MRNDVKLAQLRGKFAQLHALEGYDAQARGRRFNEFIAELLECWGIKTRVNQRSAGEIDVAFSIGDVRYILEAKWERTKTNTGQIAKLQKRVRQRLSGTHGIFLSMSGYSAEALKEVAHGERLEILLLGAEHLDAILSGALSPQQLLSAVRDAASFQGQAFTPMTEITARPSQTSGAARSDQREDYPPQPPARISAGTPAPPFTDGADIYGALPWNPVRADRGNPKNHYVAFVGRQGVYVLLTFLLGLFVVVLTFIFFNVETVGKISSVAAILFCLLLMLGFGNMARLPIRFEVGVNGMQVFARRETTWVPWEVVDRVDVVRVEGNPHVVAWSRYANQFPETDTLRGGPRFLPHLGAIAVCPLNVLRARRHQVVRALHLYAGNRI